MYNRLRRVLLTTSIVLAIPTLVAAQASGAGPSDAEVEALFDELQQVHHQLEDLQMQALQDPTLSAEQAQLGEAIEAAMTQADPTISDRLARADALEAEAVSAQTAGNGQRLQELMVEAQEIQQHFMTVQQQVLEQPAIAERLAGFQSRLEQKMLELDPAAAGLIARFRELETQLTAAMTGA